LKLGEQFLEHLGALPPRQARGEHLVSVGRDAETTGRIPAGENDQKYAGNDYGERIAPAKIDQADKQSRKCHEDPRRCRMRRSMDDRLGLYRKMTLLGQPFPVGWQHARGCRADSPSGRNGYGTMPPDNSAVFCHSLTTKPAPP